MARGAPGNCDACCALGGKVFPYDWKFPRYGNGDIIGGDICWLFGRCLGVSGSVLSFLDWIAFINVSTSVLNAASSPFLTGDCTVSECIDVDDGGGGVGGWVWSCACEYEYETMLVCGDEW